MKKLLKLLTNAPVAIALAFLLVGAPSAPMVKMVPDASVGVAHAAAECGTNNPTCGPYDLNWRKKVARRIGDWVGRIATADWVRGILGITWEDIGNFLRDMLNDIGQRAMDRQSAHRARMAADCVERVNRGEETMRYCFRRYRSELRDAGLTPEAVEVWRRTA